MVAKENEEVLLEAWRQEEQLLIEKDMKVCPISLHSCIVTELFLWVSLSSEERGLCS